MAFAIFGDSYVKRLQMYAHEKLGPNYRFYGVSGMSTEKKCELKFEELIHDRPRYVFVNLGGNNIDATSDPSKIFDDLVRIAQQLKETGVEKVYVCSIIERGSFPRFTGIDQVQFNKVRRSVNNKLSRYFGEYYVDMGKYVRYPKHYDKDLVHPGSREGGLKLFGDVIVRSFTARGRRRR